MAHVRRQTPSGISEAIRDAWLTGCLADLQTYLTQGRPAPIPQPPVSDASPAGPSEESGRRALEQTQVS